VVQYDNRLKGPESLKRACFSSQYYSQASQNGSVLLSIAFLVCDIHQYQCKYQVSVLIDCLHEAAVYQKNCGNR